MTITIGAPINPAAQDGAGVAVVTERIARFFEQARLRVRLSRGAS